MARAGDATAIRDVMIEEVLPWDWSNLPIPMGFVGECGMWRRLPRAPI
jgi:hypothetical protein